jgi:hypothetical protein
LLAKKGRRRRRWRRIGVGRLVLNLERGLLEDN